ncbi:MAG: helix-turn-helix domain-containing protein [Pseudomonadota bacterium]
MANPAKKRDTGCPFAFGLDTFGDRWTLLVIRDLMFRSSKTYGEFLATDEKIATNVLADRLKSLEAEGIIRKARDPENQRSYIYSLTEKGCDLAPLMLEMVRWSAKYDPRTKARKNILEKIETDREGFVAEICERLLKD